MLFLPKYGTSDVCAATGAASPPAKSARATASIGTAADGDGLRGIREYLGCESAIGRSAIGDPPMDPIADTGILLSWASPCKRRARPFAGFAGRFVLSLSRPRRFSATMARRRE